MNPPDHAAVFCIDEKTQVQALDRTQPIFRLLPGFPSGRATNINAMARSTYAALNLATGEILHQLTPQHRVIECKKFLVQIDKAVPAGLDIHVVIDNASTHKTPAIQNWLVRRPRFHFHFTPTSSSWMNLVLVRRTHEKWLRRGTHCSVTQLASSITEWVNTWNTNPRPYVSHKTADEIIDSLARYCQRISATPH
jgi:transposase